MYFCSRWPSLRAQEILLLRGNFPSPPFAENLITCTLNRSPNRIKHNENRTKRGPPSWALELARGFVAESALFVLGEVGWSAGATLETDYHLKRWPRHWQREEGTAPGLASFAAGSALTVTYESSRDGLPTIWGTPLIPRDLFSSENTTLLRPYSPQPVAGNPNSAALSTPAQQTLAVPGSDP